MSWAGCSPVRPARPILKGNAVKHPPKSRGLQHPRGERGSQVVEFALAMAFLVPLFAGAFSIGLTLAKGVQLSNVCWDSVVLMVDATTDPESGLDLSQAQNQKIIVSAANGLGLATGSNSTGNSVVYLSKVVMVGPTECSEGVSGGSAPWSASNCPNYGQYAFEYRIAFGNTSRWSSTLGAPPSADVASNGTISYANIATDTNNRATNMGSGGIITLAPSNFALIAEMYADVTSINLFSIWNTPVMYARSIS